MFYKDQLKKISVIIPAYNVEDYIEYCLDSVVNQVYTNIEIIVVDDGSDDLTPEILDFWYEQYPEKIKVIHMVHGGVGHARNVGLSVATGDYIAFVDADDEIDKNMYKEMLKVAENQKSDIVICNVLLNEEKIGGKKIVQHSINFGEWSKENYLSGGINLCSPCNKLFHRRTFVGKEFRCITYEDMELIPVLISKVNAISFIRKHYYHYNRRDNSITAKDFHVEDLFEAIASSIENVMEEHKPLLSYWHAQSLISLANNEKREYVDELTSLVNRNLHLFLNNDLIINNPYTVKIIQGKLVQPECCVESPDIFLTIISDLNQELIRNNVLKNVSENVQILSRITVHQQQIRGKFILCLDEYVELPEKIISTVDLMNHIYGGSTYVFAVPKIKSTAKPRMVNVEKNPQLITLDNYIYIMNTEALKGLKIQLSYNKREILYYMLLEKKKIYILEQLCVLDIDYLKQELEEKEQFAVYQQVLKADIDKSIQCCMTLFLAVPTYIQHYIMADIRKLVETDYSDDLVNTEDFIEYRNHIQHVLSMISDDVIEGLEKLTPEHKLFYFNMKYQAEADTLSSKEGLKLVYNGRCIYIQDNTYTMFEFCDYENDELRLEGRTICLNINENEDISFFAVVNGEIRMAQKLARNVDKYCLGELLYGGIEFEIRIPIETNQEDYKIRFFYMYRGNKIARRDIRFGKYFPLTKKYEASYYQKKDRILTYDDEEKVFHFRIWGRKGRIWKEKAFLAELKEKFSEYEYRQIARLRKAYLIREMLPFHKHRIWMISDKMNRGDDNGEAFFRFMNSTRNTRKRVKSYYLMDKNCSDYLRIKKIGKVVQFNSFRHKLLSLICEYHFTAYANDAVTKPLLKYNDCFKDIMRREWIVFLQHGPTQNNVSSALNKYNQNFKAIVTINEEERNSFLKYNYFYRKEQIILTGFPRYDYLKNADKKFITIAPTWRRKLFGQFIHQEERYILKEGFKESDYYKFYAGIINSSVLRGAIKEKGYELHFIPHPVFFPYINEFDFGSNVVIHGNDVSYNQMFCESSLFITDYSSAVFDCAYLMKPVIYTQFDTEEFYKSQYERGMFDYDMEGFGPVVDSIEGAVEKIVGYINNDCKMEEMYKKRALEYFKYRDKKNANRIFEELF